MKYVIDRRLVEEVREEFKKSLPVIKDNLEHHNKELTINTLQPYLSSFALLQQKRPVLYLKSIFSWVGENDFNKAIRELEELEHDLFL